MYITNGSKIKLHFLSDNQMTHKKLAVTIVITTLIVLFGKPNWFRLTLKILNWNSVQGQILFYILLYHAVNNKLTTVTKLEYKILTIEFGLKNERRIVNSITLGWSWKWTEFNSSNKLNKYINSINKFLCNIVHNVQKLTHFN